jgi:ABC-type dipeptide/oligopeptide/nickel transport system permease component
MRFIAAALTVIGNFLADVLYAYADPRIRYR